MVLVDGSGEGACDDWGEWPERFADQGAVVLTHDKPGCGGSPGDWTAQSFADRAHESLAAAAVLREHPSASEQPVGLVAFSQGGWVSLLAATLDASRVDFIVSVSGPGVGPAEQERDRIEREQRARGIAGAELAEALTWIDERARRLIAGEDVGSVLADQKRISDRKWYEGATQYFDNRAGARLSRAQPRFRPGAGVATDALPGARAPRRERHARPYRRQRHRLREAPASLSRNRHGIAVFPGADHGLFTADPDPEVPRTDRLAPGVLPMVAGFLADALRSREPTSP